MNRAENVDKQVDKQVEHYLHEHVPLSAAMGVRVRLATPQRVELAAPLAPNINHRETLFGGSAAAIAVLCAWCLLNLRMQQNGLDGRLVIQSNTMQYDEPVPGDFTAVATLDDESLWQRFQRTFERHGRGRIALGARILYGGRVAATFEGQFVALTAR